MNALPVGLEQTADSQSRSQYFGKLDELGFDIAYVRLRADECRSASESLRKACADFTSEAAGAGYPPCAEVISSVAASKHLGIEEAQYDGSDNPVRLGTKKFAPSPASDIWRKQLKDLVTTCVRDLGFQWVVVEEPEFLVDVPGPKDPFAGKFAVQYPDVRYPTAAQESFEYLTVQQAKAEAILEFLADLVGHAKEMGARKVGVMPQVLMPNAKAQAERIPRTACDIARLAQLSDVDFLVSRMTAGEVHSKSVVIPPKAKKPVDACRVEVAALAAAKPVIAAGSPLTDSAKPEVLSFDFYRDCLLATMAACPSGFVSQDFEQGASRDEAHWKLTSDAAVYAGRLGRPHAQVAFVLSDSGSRHQPPHDHASVFGHYWAFAEHMALNEPVPMLTFHASTLRRSLADHPEVRVLVFEEHFPLSVEQIVPIRDWWQGPDRRAIVAFGSGLGLSADANYPGARPISYALPGVLELIGLRQEPDQPAFSTDGRITVRDVSRVRRSAFLGDSLSEGLMQVANVRRVFGSRAAVLYDAAVEDVRLPIVAEWKDRTTLALFCGFGLSSETTRAAALAVRYALHEAGGPPAIITDCTDGLLWNITEHGYVILSNISGKKGTAVGRPGRNTFWDCREQRMLPDGNPEFSVDPHSFSVYRVVGRRSKFFDIEGAASLRTLVDGAGRADIELLAGRRTTLVLRSLPKAILVDGRPSAATHEMINNAYRVALEQCPSGEHKIGIRW